MPGVLSAFKAELHKRIEEAVTSAASQTTEMAREAAPVRRIFRGSGRRRVRFLSGRELAHERATRRKLGLAFSGPIGVEKETRPNRRLYGLPIRKNPLNLFSPQFSKAGQARITHALRMNPRGPTTYEELQSSLQDTVKAGTFRGVVSGRRLAGGSPVEAELTAAARADLKSGRGIHEHVETRAGRRVVTKRTFGGALRDSVRQGPTVVRGSITKASVIAGNEEAYYAKYVEFGTRHAAGQPFLRPALAKMRQEYRERIAKAINQSTRKRGSVAPTPARKAI